MKFIILTLLTVCLAAGAAAYDEEGLPEIITSTDTAKNSEEEGAPIIQESDEDLAAFVTDYIRRDIQLKGAFFLEDGATRKVHRLQLDSVKKSTLPGANGERGVTAVFNDEAGKKFTALFWVQAGPWGGLDIFRIDFNTPHGKGKEGKR
jgi:hypothetical protein